MPDITISDAVTSATLHLKDDAINLAWLKTGSSAFMKLLNQPLGASKFKEASFQVKLSEPKIDLGGNRALVVKAGETCGIHAFRHEDKCLFSGDECDPVNIEDGDQWISFQLATDLDAAGSLPVAPGFGVAVEVSAQPVLTTYLRFPKSGPEPALQDAVGSTISSFAVLRSGADVMAVSAGAVHSCDLTGSIKLSGSYSLPVACNQLSLADEHLPFNETVKLAPAVKMTVTGTITLAGEFRFRARRTDAKTVQIGLYKKRGTTLSAGFVAGAGLVVDVGTTDLISAFFGAVAPNVDVKPASLPEADAEKIGKALKECLAGTLSVGVNLACSAARADEAAVLYAVDVTESQQGTERALDLALRGDWTELAACPNATKVRNAVIETLTTGATFRINVLGVYNYESTEEFMRSSTVLYGDDRSVTITDKARADWIAVAATPYLADADRLRLALHQGFLATATWKALLAGARISSSFVARQDFFVYKQSMDPNEVRKNLIAGVFLGLLPDSRLAAVPAHAVSHARFEASAEYQNTAVLKLFFSDVTARTPRELPSYLNLGRDVMAALLDSTQPTDQERQSVLRSDQKWNHLDSQYPKPSGPSYGDWFDITMWSGAFAAVGPALRDALKAADACVGNPVQDDGFMQKRARLAHDMANASKQLRSAFEPGWPLALCVALAGVAKGDVTLTFHAAWDGKPLFDTPKPGPVVAHAGAN